jgi:hypothetical protein
MYIIVYTYMQVSAGTHYFLCIICVHISKKVCYLMRSTMIHNNEKTVTEMTTMNSKLTNTNLA